MSHFPNAAFDVVALAASAGQPARRTWLMARAGNEETMDHLARHVRLREATFETSPVAQIVLDPHGVLVQANERARALLGLTTQHLGRRFQELEFSPSQGQLHACIEQAWAERRPVSLKELKRFRRQAP